jgi:hypothetical protein
MIRYSLVVVASVLIACSSSKNEGKYEIQETRLVERQLSRNPPSEFISFCEIYVKASNDSIYQTNFLNLQNYHMLSHQNVFSSIQEFMLSSLNQKSVIDLNVVGASQLIKNGFAINQSVSDQYKRGGIDLIKKLYCADADSSSIVLKNRNEQNASTISYYLFLNKYLKLSNDSANRYRKISTYLY